MIWPAPAVVDGVPVGVQLSCAVAGAVLQKSGVSSPQSASRASVVSPGQPTMAGAVRSRSRTLNAQLSRLPLASVATRVTSCTVLSPLSRVPAGGRCTTVMVSPWSHWLLTLASV